MLIQAQESRQISLTWRYSWRTHPRTCDIVYPAAYCIIRPPHRRDFLSTTFLVMQLLSVIYIFCHVGVSSRLMRKYTLEDIIYL